MVTVPWYRVGAGPVSKANPLGVAGHESAELLASVNEDTSTVTLTTPLGGDFAGFTEERIAVMRAGMRPLITPGDTGRKDLVPHYEAQEVAVTLPVGRSAVTVYPGPDRQLDYGFCDHPRVFYEQGLEVRTGGGRVSLKVGRRRAYRLRGSVRLLLGRRACEDGGGHLLWHVYLRALARLLAGDSPGPQ